MSYTEYSDELVYTWNQHAVLNIPADREVTFTWMRWKSIADEYGTNMYSPYAYNQSHNKWLSYGNIVGINWSSYQGYYGSGQYLKNGDNAIYPYYAWEWGSPPEGFSRTGLCQIKYTWDYKHVTPTGYGKLRSGSNITFRLCNPSDPNLQYPCLRTYEKSAVKCIELVDTTHPEASGLRIKTASGIRAIRKVI
jgi:hypothetical protein